MQAHCAWPTWMSIVLTAKRHVLVGQTEQAVVGDRDAVRVAAEIVEHLLRTAERLLGIDDPFAMTRTRQIAGKFAGLGQMSQ